MTDYNEYIKQLRQHQVGIDYDRMYQQIKSRPGPVRYWPRFVVAGALAVACFVFGFYFGLGQETQLASRASDEPVMDYVLSSHDDNNVDGPVLNYVLYDY